MKWSIDVSLKVSVLNRISSETQILTSFFWLIQLLFTCTVIKPERSFLFNKSSTPNTDKKLFKAAEAEAGLQIHWLPVEMKCQINACVFI